MQKLDKIEIDIKPIVTSPILQQQHNIDPSSFEILIYEDYHMAELDCSHLVIKIRDSWFETAPLPHSTWKCEECIKIIRQHEAREVIMIKYNLLMQSGKITWTCKKCCSILKIIFEHLRN